MFALQNVTHSTAPLAVEGFSLIELLAVMIILGLLARRRW